MSSGGRYPLMDKGVIAKEIKNLDTKMSVPQDHIPVKKLKNNRHEKQTYRHYRLIDLSKYSNVAFVIKSIKLSTIQCLGIKWTTERYSSQHSLIAMFENSKKSLDNGKEMWYFISRFTQRI